MLKVTNALSHSPIVQWASLVRWHSHAQEMADQSPAAAPLRRQAALVLAKWVPRATDADRPAAYSALLQLLSCDDAAIQLAAINALQARLPPSNLRLPNWTPATHCTSGNMSCYESTKTVRQTTNHR